MQSKNGASEIGSIVINIGDVKDGRFDVVEDEIRQIPMKRVMDIS